MAKKRLKDIADECEVSFEEAMEIALDKLPAGSLAARVRTLGLRKILQRFFLRVA